MHPGGIVCCHLVSIRDAAARAAAAAAATKTLLHHLGKGALMLCLQLL
jgi:hypothetical protein